MARSARDVLMTMMSGSVFYGADTLTGHHKRVDPSIIGTTPYLCHDMHDHPVIAIGVSVDVEWEQLLNERKFPSPTLIITPKDPVNHWRWLLWELRIPVIKKNIDATIYWRDTMIKVSRLLTLMDPASFRFFGNPLNRDLWTTEFRDHQYELKDLREGATAQLRDGEWSDEDYARILDDLYRHAIRPLMRLRREGCDRELLEKEAETKIQWVLKEFDYSDKLFGADLRNEVALHVEVLLHRSPEEWAGKFSEIQSARGSRKGADDRTLLLPEALKLRTGGYSDRQIGKRLNKDHKTIGNWFREFDANKSK